MTSSHRSFRYLISWIWHMILTNGVLYLPIKPENIQKSGFVHSLVPFSMKKSRIGCIRSWMGIPDLTVSANRKRCMWTPIIQCIMEKRSGYGTRVNVSCSLQMNWNRIFWSGWRKRQEIHWYISKIKMWHMRHFMNWSIIRQQLPWTRYRCSYPAAGIFSMQSRGV